MPELMQELPVGYEEEAEDNPLLRYLDMGNIVDELPDPQHCAQKTQELYDEACESMKPWQKKYDRAMALAKMQPQANGKDIDKKSFPFDGASLAMMPFILEAMIDFSSRAAPELVWSKSIAHAVINGEETEEKTERAKRKSTYFNYQLTNDIPDWREDQDKGIFILSCPGTFYKETYYDSDIDEVRSDLLLADEIKFDHNCKSFSKAQHKFKDCTYTRNDVIGFIRGEQGWAIEEDELDEDEDENEFIQAYTWIDMDEDGLKEPYIAILWPEKGRIVAVYPCFDEDSINENEDGELVKVEMCERLTQYRYLPDPEGGPMGLGWGILLGPMFDAINTNVRQLIDGGTLANAAANSGLYAPDAASGRGNATEARAIELRLGQLTPIKTRGNSNLSQNIMQFPFSGPNVTLFNLVQWLVENMRNMTSSATAIESSPNEAAALYLAKLQQGLKAPNLIIMRVYECQTQEIKKIEALDLKHFNDKKYNKVLDGNYSMRADFEQDDCDISLTADPSHGSDVERAARAQAILQEAKEQPTQILNVRQAYIDWLESLNAPNVDMLAPEQEGPDPMQQLMVAQMQKDAEMEQRGQQLREQDLQIKARKQQLEEQRMALEVAKEMKAAGIDTDEAQARIAKLYAETQQIIMETGLAQSQAAMDVVDRIEARFIEESNGQVPTTNPGSS